MWEKIRVIFTIPELRQKIKELIVSSLRLEGVEPASIADFAQDDRNLLVLFKLHPLPGGQVRDPRTLNLRAPLPGDRIDIPVD